MGKFFNSGEENGIKWDIEWKNGWEIVVTKDNKTKIVTIEGRPPIFGVDVDDISNVNKKLDEIINEFYQNE